MKKYILVLVILGSFKGFGAKISLAYKALSIYDYFKAKELFYASLAKNPAEAGYGLATIYFRSDNPFSNIDSAAKYIDKSAKTFKDTVTLSGYFISRATITALSHSVSLKGFQIYSGTKQVHELNHFLQQFYFSSDSLLNIASSYARQCLPEKIQCPVLQRQHAGIFTCTPGK